jgi:hypothetical protein
MTAGNGHDGNGGLVPRFLELKRMVPHLRRFKDWYKPLVQRLADAPAFVVELAQDRKLGGKVLATAFTSAKAGELLLPCDPCLIEFTGVDLDYILMAYSHSSTPDAWLIAPWFDREEGWLPSHFVTVFWPATLDYSIAATGKEVSVTRELFEKDSEWIQNTVNAVVVASWLVAQAGTVETMQVGSTTRRLMQAKGIRGWQYRLVTLTPEVAARAARSEHQGGTHASPRWHLRRAHLRRLKNGKMVAIRSCEVSTTEHGGIVKDYRVKDPHHEPEPPPPLPRA